MTLKIASVPFYVSALILTVGGNYPVYAQNVPNNPSHQSLAELSAVFTAAGLIESTAGGYIFPDGTIQATAAAGSASCLAGIGSLSPNVGMYSNRIPDASPPNAYTEICVSGGDLLSDIHEAGESTTGGDCLPGDTGWLIERNQRMAESWENAKLKCLIDGMRLPELFEYKVSCNYSDVLQIINISDGWEWASNTALPYDGGNHVTILGAGGDCKHADRASVGNQNGNEGIFQYRCVR